MKNPTIPANSQENAAVTRTPSVLFAGWTQCARLALPDFYNIRDFFRATPSCVPLLRPGGRPPRQTTFFVSFALLFFGDDGLPHARHCSRAKTERNRRPRYAAPRFAYPSRKVPATTLISSWFRGFFSRLGPGREALSARIIRKNPADRSLGTLRLPVMEPLPIRVYARLRVQVLRLAVFLARNAFINPPLSTLGMSVLRIKRVCGFLIVKWMEKNGGGRYE